MKPLNNILKYVWTAGLFFITTLFSKYQNQVTIK